MIIRGVIFDLDGTLVDSGLDFKQIRAELGLGPEPILEAIALLPEQRRRECEAVLSRHEISGAMRATLHHGVEAWLEELDENKIHRAIFTRNARSIVELTLDRCRLPFEDVITREDGPPKPDPAGIHELCRRWNIEPHEVMIIGDYLYDVMAGRNAGSKSALVTHGRSWDFAHLADFVWQDLTEGLNEFRRWRSTRPN